MGVGYMLIYEDNKMTEINSCTHLEDILKAEVPLIKRHIERHKWFKHIGNENDAMIDFIEMYGFIMREFYCTYVCDERKSCNLSKQYLNEY